MLNNLMRFLSISFLSALILAAPAAAAPCENLAALSLPDGKVTSAVVVGTGAFAASTGGFGGGSAFKSRDYDKDLAATFKTGSDITDIPSDGLAKFFESGGDAPSVTDMISVIDQWVEKGKAPDSILATNPPNQKPMSRPICPYP